MNFLKIMSQPIDLPKNNDQLNATSPRLRFAQRILAYHFALIVLASIFYLIEGFDRQEFTSLMGMLAPITALYGGVVFKFLGKSIAEPAPDLPIAAPDIAKTVNWLVMGHFLLVAALMTSKALFNFIDFEELTMFFTFVEAGLGVYLGGILTAVFDKR